MNKTFEKIWEIHKAGGPRGNITGEKPRAEAAFDSPVKAGEIRLFADIARPFTALVAEERGAAGCLLIPVSPFPVPASTREALEGERVYQLWNAVTASKKFTGRSWLVDTVDDETLAGLKARCVEKTSLAAEGPLAEYEREFLVAGGDFVPLVEKGAPQVVRIPWRRITGIAACFVVLLGVGVALFNDRGRVGEPVSLPVGRAQPEPADAASPHPVNAPVELKNIRPQQVDACVAPRVMRSPAVMKSMLGSRKAKVMMRSRAPAAQEAAAMSPQRFVPAGTERYVDFRENDWRDPSSEPLSTFGLDVDTSSYTTMRRYLTEMKCLPPKESVRLEEYVNYFKYRYPQPAGDEPVAVACEMGVCPWAPTHKLLRIGVQAKEIPVDRLPPCNLTFLIDVSGSMGWNGGFAMMKAGLRLLVDKLRPEDRVAIVTYASGTSVRLASTPGTEKAKILAAIDALSSGGGTSGSAGVQLAYDEAKKGFRKDANNRVVLVTDGDFNIGLSSPQALEKFIADKRESGIFLTVLGVGRGNYRDNVMKKLSSAGNGNYAYLDSVLEAKKVMMNEFGGTLFTVAKDVKLQLEFNPAEVKGYRLLGYETRRLAAKDFNDDKKDAGEIGSGHTMTAFYEIIPAGSPEQIGSVDPLKYQKRTASGSGEVCTVKLRWKKPDGDKSLLAAIPVDARKITAKVPSEDFRFAAAVAEFALLLSDSKHKGAASFGSVLGAARHAKGQDLEGYRAEFVRLVETAELLSK